MFYNKKIKISTNFIDNCNNMEPGTRLGMVEYDSKVYYMALLYQGATTFEEFDIDYTTIVQAIINHGEQEVSCKRPSYQGSHFVFIYNKDSEFINGILASAAVPMSFEWNMKEVNIPCSIQISESIEPIYASEEKRASRIGLFLVNNFNETMEVNLEDYEVEIGSSSLKFKDGFISLIDAELKDKNPIEPTTRVKVPVCINIKTKEYEGSKSASILVIYDNTQEIKSNNLNLQLSSKLFSGDIEALANAIFEIDEKLMLSKNVLSADNSYLIELWIRWIQTGRKTLDECPEQYLAIVKEILEV